MAALHFASFFFLFFNTRRILWQNRSTGCCGSVQAEFLLRSGFQPPLICHCGFYCVKSIIVWQLHEHVEPQRDSEAVIIKIRRSDGVTVEVSQ